MNRQGHNLSFKYTIQLFLNLTVRYHYTVSILGFFLVLVFISQILSGIMLSFSLVPECMLVPVVRDEEDLEDLFVDDFFWLHERGVDIIFIFSYLHLFRKLYLSSYYLEQEYAWKTGVFSLIVIQVVTFLGLVLCCTHLSDITLKIASNTLHTFFFLKGKFYWWLFTDKDLNTDTLIRLAYAHYVLAFLLFVLATTHSIDMHYDWKPDYHYDGMDNELQWWNEASINEIMSFLDLMMFVFLVCLYMYNEPEALSYEIFMWGDVGAITDPKFNQVAPHWYFRPLMSFLLVVPHSFMGVFGLILFFFLLYYQITLSRSNEVDAFSKFSPAVAARLQPYKLHMSGQLEVEYSFFRQMTFFAFLAACLYTTTFLPNGKYYQLLGGNTGMLLSYFYIFFYLTFPRFRSFSFNRRNLRRISYTTSVLSNKFFRKLKFK
jgi:quinol-cytochrome oxidoreductase complex cytochrome b subunit